MKQNIEMTKQTMDEFMSLYATNVMMLTKIVQRQQEQIYKLEERIEVLERKN